MGITDVILELDSLVAVAFNKTFYLGLIKELADVPIVAFLKKSSGNDFKMPKKPLSF